MTSSSGSDPRGTDTDGPPPATGAGSLTSTLRRGMAISAVVFAVVQAVAFVQIVVLARLLSPEEVGLFAAGTVLTGFVISVSADGLHTALVQREGDVADAAETVFRAALASGVLLGLGSLAVSPLIAMVFGSTTAGVIAAATSGTLVLHSLTVVPDALMQRRFDFRRRLIVSPTITVSYAVTAIVAAALGCGVWSLVIAGYTSHVCWIVATWSLAGWRPGRGRATRRLWRELARYSAPLVVNGMAFRTREAIETVVVGSRLDEHSLGQYRYGRRLSMLPGMAVMEIGSYVLLPAFSRIAGDEVRFREAFRRALGLIWTAAVAVAGVIVVLGVPLVVLLLGSPWREAGIALTAMAGIGLGEALGGVADEAVKGSGRSAMLHWTTVVSIVATVGLLLALVPFGLLGVGLAISGANLAMGVTAVVVAARVTVIRIRDVLGSLGPALVAAVLAGAAVWPLEHLLLHSDTLPTALGLLALAGEGLLFGVLYLAVLRVVAPSMASALLGSLRGLLDRGQRADA